MRLWFFVSENGVYHQMLMIAHEEGPDGSGDDDPSTVLGYRI